MLLVDEPGTRRMFVNDMRGPLHTVSYDGRTVTPYLDINDPKWGVNVQSMGRERGFQSFALHPQFGRAGTPGAGKLYTWTDSANTTPRPDFTPGGGNRTHHTVLFEWTARNPGAATYDGGPPRELLRLEQPFQNHNAGHMSFNPNAAPGSAEFGLLYVAVADGGSGGDPLNLAQNLGSPFGKMSENRSSWIEQQPMASTEFRPAIRLSAKTACSERFTSMGFAILSVLAGTRETEICLSPTLARTSSRSSAWREQARISVGTNGRVVSGL